jgi:plastocyanin
MPSGYLRIFMVLMLSAGCCAARAETIPVTIRSLVFSPGQTHAKVGDTIEWINMDIVAHTATARGGEWKEVVIAEHKSTGQVMSKAGTVEYYCRYHPNMHGTITVAPK